METTTTEGDQILIKGLNDFSRNDGAQQSASFRRPSYFDEDKVQRGICTKEEMNNNMKLQDFLRRSQMSQMVPSHN